MPREQARALTTLLDLKEVARAGWLEHGIPALATESVADHSFGMALLATLLPLPVEVDRHRLAALCLLHDLAEAIVGDFTPHNAPADKHVQEQTALAGQLARLRAAEVLQKGADSLQAALITDDRTDPTTAWVHYLDRFERLLQAYRYRCAGLGVDLAEFAHTPHGLEGTPLAAMADVLVAQLRASEHPQSWH